jgi:hypothetical protein
VLFGSTFKLGAGTNVQDKLVAIHDADCPWRPADLEQRAGRIIRQGNSNPEVKIFRYATSGTFDSYLWQTVESKQKFISQIMSSKSPVRSCEDVDETALSYAEIKALCAGNPHIREKMELDVEVAKLRLLKAEHQSQHYRLEDNLLKKFPEQITAITARIAGIEKDIERYNAERGKCVDVQTTVTSNASVSTKFAGMTINDTFYEEKEPAAKALLDACKGVTDKTDKPVGEYMGFTLTIRYDSFSQQMQLLLRGAMTYITDLGTDAFGNITRINNALDKLPERLEGAKTQLIDVNSQVEAAKLELENPFPQETELQEKSARLALLNADLNIDGDGGFDVENDSQEQSESEHGNAEDGRDSDDDLEGDDDRDGNDYRYANDEPRTGTYGKTKPSILDGIRNFDSGRFNNTTKLPSDQRGVVNRE